MFPRGWISFGILHGMAVMLLLLRLGLARWPAWALLLLAAAALVAPQLGNHPSLTAAGPTGWAWSRTKPVTETTPPCCPGWVSCCSASCSPRSQPERWSGRLPPGARGLALLGRWPLSIYMLHQPVLLGLFGLLTVL